MIEIKSFGYSKRVSAKKNNIFFNDAVNNSFETKI